MAATVSPNSVNYYSTTTGSATLCPNCGNNPYIVTSTYTSPSLTCSERIDLMKTLTDLYSHIREDSPLQEGIQRKLKELIEGIEC